MKKDENTAFKYLQNLGYTNIIYEPDGNIPPDFLINNTVAIEVRRLNISDNKGKGLDQCKTIWVDNELEKYIQKYSDEKFLKIAPHKHKYKEWWLILVNYIDYSTINIDDFNISHKWDKILIIEP